MSSAQSGRLAYVRWLVGLVLLALMGLVGFVAYVRYLRPAEPVASGGPHDSRLDSFLARADERLAVGDLDGAKEQYFKASGLSDRDPRVTQGLARVEVLRTELAWWTWLSLADEDSDERDAAEQDLTRAAREAVDAIERAVDKAPASPESKRLQVARHRVEAMVIYALMRAGKTEAAEKNLDQLVAQNRSHPVLDALRRVVGGPSKSRESDEEADASAEPDASASPTAKPASGGSRVEHYEFDHEPAPPIKVPGELEIPVTPGEGPSPSPAPGDTSDL